MHSVGEANNNNNNNDNNNNTVYREIFVALNFRETNFCEINFREWPMRPTWPLPVGGISRNLISRESKNREIHENLGLRKFPGIR